MESSTRQCVLSSDSCSLATLPCHSFARDHAGVSPRIAIAAPHLSKNRRTRGFRTARQQGNRRRAFDEEGACRVARATVGSTRTAQTQDQAAGQCCSTHH